MNWRHLSAMATALDAASDAHLQLADCAYRRDEEDLQAARVDLREALGVVLEAWIDLNR